MTGKGRTGPRERQTMSGILSDRREPGGAAGPTPAAAGRAPAPTVEDETETIIIEQQALAQLSLWKRMLEAAEREFERDSPSLNDGAGATDERRWANGDKRGDRNGRDRDKDET